MIDAENAAKACVVGAGVSGLATAKVLLADGFDVDLLEKKSGLGGTWHPSRTYPGLRTNDPKELYRFSDFPYPESSHAANDRSLAGKLTAIGQLTGMQPLPLET